MVERSVCASEVALVGRAYQVDHVVPTSALDVVVLPRVLVDVGGAAAC